MKLNRGLAAFFIAPYLLVFSPWANGQSNYTAGDPGALIDANNAVEADAARANAIPFRLQGGFLIEVEGGIGHLEGLKFVLDTGTTHSVIDRRIANRFSIVRRSKQVFNFDRYVRVEWAEFPDLHFGSIVARNVSMMVTELAKSSGLIGDADAVIGLDLLTTSSAIGIFYDSKMLVLKPRFANARGTAEGATPECVTVQAMIQGHPIRLILDTGMDGVLLYEDRIRKLVPDLRLADVQENAHMGRLQGKTARLHGLRLDSQDSDAKVFLMNGPREELLPGIVGYLGISPLKAKRIEVDFEGKTLRWH
jgi:hypothetical protein